MNRVRYRYHHDTGMAPLNKQTLDLSKVNNTKSLEHKVEVRVVEGAVALACSYYFVHLYEYA